MKKKFYLGLSLILLICIPRVSGCARPPESKKQTVKEALEEYTDYQTTLPESVEKTITTDSGKQEINAAVECTIEGKVTEGTLENRTFSIDGAKEAMEKCGYSTEDGNLEIIVEQGLLIRDERFKKNLGEVKESSQDGGEEFIAKVEEFFSELQLHQKVESYSIEVTEEEEEIFSFETTGVYKGLSMESLLSESGGSLFSGYGELIQGELAELMVISDFQEKETKEAGLLDFSEIISAYEKLMDDGVIRCVASGQPIERIRMAYMVEKTQNGYEYYPVWNFEVSYVADWLKGSNTPQESRYVVLDARNGNLVDYNSGGE